MPQPTKPKTTTPRKRTPRKPRAPKFVPIEGGNAGKCPKSAQEEFHTMFYSMSPEQRDGVTKLLQWMTGGPLFKHGSGYKTFLHYSREFLTQVSTIGQL